MEPSICNWTPQIIVELIKAIIWPLAIIFVSFKFRSRIIEKLKEFFSKYNLSSLKASTSGVEAQFNAVSKQVSKTTDNSNSNSNIRENLPLEAINKIHSEASTLFSEERYTSIKAHLSALGLEEKAQIDLLSKETAILTTEKIYSHINKAIFRSQFELLNNVNGSDLYISNSNLLSYFDEVKKAAGEELLSWDWINYISYLVNNNLIMRESNGYKLTNLGISYVEFMFSNPSMINELIKL